jgi:hypothetical protein
VNSIDQLRIDTPEQIALELPLAGIGSRFLALAIDTVIQSVFISSRHSYSYSARRILRIDISSEIVGSGLGDLHSVCHLLGVILLSSNLSGRGKRRESAMPASASSKNRAGRSTPLSNRTELDACSRWAAGHLWCGPSVHDVKPAEPKAGRFCGGHGGRTREAHRRRPAFVEYLGPRNGAPLRA